MSYQPYLIAPFATGINKYLQPWLSPDDAQEDLFDGYVYRGVISKRQGYSPYAYGLRGVQPATESRMVDNVGAFSTEPVMGIMNFITRTNIKELLVADTRRVNKYNSTLNILEYLGSTTRVYTGNNTNFWSSVNYKDANSNERLIFTNNKDEVQYYAPTSVPTVGDYVTYPGFAMNTSTNPPVAVTSFFALLTVISKDRLIFLRTTENGITRPNRIRISGTGASCDDFRTSATGAGFIDIPDQTWIMGATFSRDDLVIFTESSTWLMKYTGNDTTPFVLQKLDDTRGSQAPFSAITYLNRSSAASPRGLIMTDGYRVERQDEKIPDFSFNEIDADNFDLCFAGSVDADRDHYLIYPTQGETTSQRILVTNYEEDNYAVYRLPISCMGTYLLAFDITWNDLLIYNNWAEFAAVYGDWNSFAYGEGSPITLAGGHKGELWQLNTIEGEDNPQTITNITIIDSNTLEITTTWNNFSLNTNDQEKGADVIYLTGIVGMVEANNKQYPIVSVTNNNVFRVNVPSTTNFSAYVSGGKASRVIPFSATFKSFNPYIEIDKKVRCGYINFFVSASGTSLTRDVVISGITQANPCVVTTNLDHDFQTGDSISFYSVGGMTELNTIEATITVISPTTFSLNGINSSSFAAYTSGGYAVVQEKCKMILDIIANDVREGIQVNNIVQNPIRCNNSSLVLEDGVKKWYQVWVNLTAQSIQFRLRNQQAGAKINIHAIMLGFQPTGKLN